MPLLPWNPPDCPPIEDEPDAPEAVATWATAIAIVGVCLATWLVGAALAVAAWRWAL